MKMENVVRPHHGASLPRLSAAVHSVCTAAPTSCWGRLRKALIHGEAKKSFPSPKTQAGEGRDMWTQSYCTPGAPSVVKHSHLL